MATGGAVALAHHAHVFPAAINAKGTLDELLKHLDACDIAQAICFAPLPYQVDSSFDSNGWLAGELKSQNRLYGFGTIDFKRPDVKDQVRRAKQLGLKGLKIHPPGQKLEILSRAAMDTYAAAEEAGLFLTFHTGVHHHRLRDARVIDWDEIAWNFPKLRFSMEHMGGWSFFNEAMAVVTNNTPPPWEHGSCKIFAGLTSVFSPKELSFWYMPRERLLELVRQAGVDQLIFGLDFPYNDLEATMRGIETIRSLDLSDADVAKILGGNLKRELGIS
jgi:uncharacterized protein